MNELALKLSLAPALVALATLVGRRFGHAAAGLTAGLPIVAGPLLLFCFLDRDAAYASRAALFCLLGILSLCLFSLAFAWLARAGGSVVSCLGAGWAAFGLGSLLVFRLMLHSQLGPWRGLAYVTAALLLCARSLPRPRPGAPAAFPSPPPAWDLPLRMAAAALLVWGLSALSSLLSPDVVGLLAPAPVASTVLASFALGQGASEAAAAVLKGLLQGLRAFAAFCAVLAWGLAAPAGWSGEAPPPRLAPAAAFALALAAALLVQTAFLLWRRRQA